MSAIFSRFSPLPFLLLIERKESTLLTINIKIATAVNSSITVLPSRFNSLREVSTIKQIPRRLDEVVRI
ncbi:MAG TPA: hypothetical protein VMU83_17660 [Hanamia sp.]|nr:hypothetical protein [Hanamia sp.]